jgi:AcrR family transcriptional regulator
MGVKDRRARQKQLLRQQILDAARELLVEEGYDQLSMRKVAERIDYSPTAIYLHFKDKQELVFSLCEESFAKLVRELETLGRKHSQLTKAKKAEGFTETEGLNNYIERAITNDGVELGEHGTDPSTVSVTKGIVDKKIRIKPTSRDKVFPRSKIANFLYKLEADSRRIRVTDLKIELGGKNKVREHEIPDDTQWTYEVEITSRQREEGK